MKKLLALLLCTPLMAQQIAPRQIAPGANGQTLQTVLGVTTWASPFSVGGVISFTNQTTVTMAYATFGFSTPYNAPFCWDTNGNGVEPNSYSSPMIAAGQYNLVITFVPAFTGSCAAFGQEGAGGGPGVFLPLAGGTQTGSTFIDSVLSGSQVPGLTDYGSVLHATDPMITNAALQTYQQALNSISINRLNLGAQEPVVIDLVDADSITNSSPGSGYVNGWAYNFTNEQQKWGYGGTGLQPILSGAGTTFRAQWNRTGTVGTRCSTDFGPVAGGVGSIYCFSGTATIIYQGSYNITATSPSANDFPRSCGDTFILEGETDSTTSTLTIVVDGTTTLTTTAGGSSGSPAVFYQQFQIPNVDPQSCHTATVSITGGSGNAMIYGGGFNTSTPGVVFNNFALGGATSASYATGNNVAFSSAVDDGTLALFIISIGVNDTGTAPSTYYTNITNAIISERNKNADASCLIVDENSTSSNFQQSALRIQEQALAQTYNCKYVSIAEHWGTEVQANARGLMSGDGTHPNAVGAENWATIVNNAISSEIMMAPPPPPVPNGVAIGYTGSQIWPISNSASGGYTAFCPGNSCTTVGTSITVGPVSDAPFLTDMSTFITANCATDTTYNVTHIRPTAVSANTITWTAPGGDGGNPTSCTLFFSTAILDASTANEFLIDDNTIEPVTLVKLENTLPGQHIAIGHRCLTATSICSSIVWPTQVLVPPAVTLLHGPGYGGIPTSEQAWSSVDISTSIVQGVPNLGSVPQGTSALMTTTLPATPLASGSCEVLTATLSPTIIAGGFVLSPTMRFTANPTGGMGATINTAPLLSIVDSHYSGGTSLNTAAVDVCNNTGSSITPATQVINVYASW